MDTNDHPSEIAELIIHFATDPLSNIFRHIANRDPGHKRTLLACALVCKTWLWPARRRLFHLNSRLRKIKTSPRNLPAIFDIFHSPLCTLDPGFIHFLEITVGPDSQQAEETLSFFKLLSTINIIPFLSLSSLIFRGVSLDFDIDQDDSPSFPVPKAFPQIKALTFESPNDNPLRFENVARATHLFPSLEILTARGTTRNCSEAVYSLRPPQSLRWLCADTSTFFRVVDWLTPFEPKHTNISTLSIYESITDHREQEVASRVSLALNILGDRLEEFNLTLYSSPNFHEHIFLFVNNPSLKKIQIEGELPLLVQFLPHISTIVSSVPHLEELGFHINPWPGGGRFSLLKEFQLLDEFTQSYPSLQRVNFQRRYVSGGWDWFQRDIRKYMPRCRVKRMISFTDSFPLY